MATKPDVQALRDFAVALVLVSHLLRLALADRRASTLLRRRARDPAAVAAARLRSPRVLRSRTLLPDIGAALGYKDNTT